MALQTQDLDVRRDVGLLKAGKMLNGFDVVGLAAATGHAGTAISTTITVTEESQSLGVHTAWAPNFQQLKVGFPDKVFEIATCT